MSFRPILDGYDIRDPSLEENHYTYVVFSPDPLKQGVCGSW
jgi:hypothetical protein